MNSAQAQSSMNGLKMERTLDIVNRGLKKRYRVERRFRFYGLLAIVASMVFLSLLFISIVGKGYSAFEQTFMELNVFFDPENLNTQSLVNADYQGLVKKSLSNMFPEVKERQAKRMLYGIVSPGASFQLRDMVLTHPDIIGQTRKVWVPADDDVDMLIKGHFDRQAAESARRLKDEQLAWIDRLSAEGKIKKKFNSTFFTAGDSREPELAGIWCRN